MMTGADALFCSSTAMDDDRSQWSSLLDRSTSSVSIKARVEVEKIKKTMSPLSSPHFTGEGHLEVHLASTASSKPFHLLMVGVRNQRRCRHHPRHGRTELPITSPVGARRRAAPMGARIRRPPPPVEAPWGCLQGLLDLWRRLDGSLGPSAQPPALSGISWPDLEAPTSPLLEFELRGQSFLGTVAEHEPLLYSLHRPAMIPD